MPGSQPSAGNAVPAAATLGLAAKPADARAPRRDAVALRLAGIRKSFGGRDVLRGLDLTVGFRETVAILGPNGAGKSTLLRIAALQSRPDSGTIHLDGEIATTATHGPRADIAYVPQDPPLFDELVVRDHVPLLAAARGHAGLDDAGLQSWGLAKAKSRRVGELSRGQRQRLALAGALGAGAAAGPQAPRLALLDEPFNALDATGQATLDEVLAARRGTRSTVLVLHDEAAARRLADRVLTLHGGVLEEV